jgi:hypothetical protein
MRLIMVGLMAGGLLVGEHELSELTRTKTQLNQARVQIAQYQASLASCQLSVERAQLAPQVIKELGGVEGDELDWATDPPTLKKKAPTPTPTP